VKLTVLGSSASYPGPGRACAGHLVSTTGARIVLDLGNGALSNLGRATDACHIDAIFISHLHPDHYLDLLGFMAMLRYAPDGPSPPVPLYGPEGLPARMRAVVSGHGRRDVGGAFAFTPLQDGQPVEVGPTIVTPRAVDHDGVTFAMVVDGDARRLVYTSDTRLSDPVRRAARGAHTLLAEATIPASYAGRVPHMTGGEAGMLATEVGAERLVLTHLWPTVPREVILDDAKAAFAGEVLLADELLVVEV
jgi:ribonuclease BN (tRNA processing enzyme)